MSRLEMKPPPFDSYEIEEPSDEEPGCSRSETLYTDSLKEASAG